MVNSLATGGHRQEYKKDWHLWKIIDVCVSFKRSFWTILNFSSGHLIIYALDHNILKWLQAFAKCDICNISIDCHSLILTWTGQPITMFKHCLVTLEGCGRGAVALWWEPSLESRTGAVEPRPGKNQHFEKSQ